MNKTEYNKLWRRKRREDPKYKLQMRAWDLKKLYSMTIEQYQTLLDNQGGVCAICAKPPGRYRLSVDHDHNTGRIRGLLCGKCNVGVVGLEDKEFVQKALAYLEVQ